MDICLAVAGRLITLLHAWSPIFPLRVSNIRILTLLILSVLATADELFSAWQGYEEVYVPALKPKPYREGEKLKQISELPSWAQPAFR